MYLPGICKSLVSVHVYDWGYNCHGLPVYTQVYCHFQDCLIHFTEVPIFSTASNTVLVEISLGGNPGIIDLIGIRFGRAPVLLGISLWLGCHYLYMGLIVEAFRKCINLINIKKEEIPCEE